MKNLTVSKFKKILVLCLLVSCSALTAGHNATAADDADARSAHKFGFYFSLLGDPFPNLWGINLAYDLTNFMRINAGYGSTSASVTSGLSTATITLMTLGGGVKFFVPHWNFSPVVGMNYTNATVSVTGNAGTNNLYGLSANASVVYANVGIDWQTHYGLDFGVGYDISFLAGVGGAPYFTLGWFF